MHKLSDALFKIIVAISMVLAALVTIIVSIQVFYRYVLNHSLEWPEELAVYLMIWMLFLGCITLARDDNQITVDTILRLIPLKVASVFKISSFVVSIVYCAYLAYYGFTTVLAGFATRSLSMGFSTNYIKVAIPISAIGMLLCYAKHFFDNSKHFRNGEYTKIIKTDIDVDSSL